MNNIFQRKTSQLPGSNVVSPGAETREQCLRGVPSGDPVGCGGQCPQTYPIEKSIAKDAQLSLMKTCTASKEQFQF